VGAAERMIASSRNKVHGIDRPVELYLAGLAPLPLFVILGMEVSSWGPPLVFLHQRKNHEWDVLPTSGQVALKQDRFFDIVHGLSNEEPFEGTGYIGLFVSTNGQPAQRDLIRTALLKDEKQLAAVVEIRTTNNKYLTEEYFPDAAEQLATTVSQIAGNYPHAAGLAVFVFGPTSLAYLVGRAINPTMFSEILIANYNSPNYEIVLRQPRPGRRTRPIPTGTEEELARAQVLKEIRAGIETIRGSIQEQDLPEFLGDEAKTNFLYNLRRVQLPTASEGESFELHVLQEQMVLGRGLLEALRRRSPESIRRIAALLLLHEVFHFDQNLQTSNYRNIGRAGVALEEIDFWADAVSVCALTLHDMRCAGPIGGDEAAARSLLTNVESVLSGIEAFDRFEQGDYINRLTERRLRRYLIWHLQLARARTRPRTKADVQLMLRERLVVELAPLIGSIDGRYEKVITRSRPTTELYVVLGKRLFRYSANANLAPEMVVECIRKFQSKELIAPMDYVLGEHHRDLAPWASRSNHLPIHNPEQP
jgi:hypothetical protein